MFGIVTLQHSGRARSAVTRGRKTICGVSFLEVRVRPSRTRLIEQRRLRRAAQLLWRAGVRRALFPVGFEDFAAFEKLGISPAREDYLRQMTAGEIARKTLAAHALSPASCTAALLGDEMTAPMRRALPEVALHVRCTMLAARGGGEICSVLRREYGVSVLRAPSAAQLKTANLVLTFGDAAPAGAPGCLWLPFGTVREVEGFTNAAPSVSYAAAPEVEAQLLEGYERNGQLSLLLEAGAVPLSALEVCQIAQKA